MEASLRRRIGNRQWYHQRFDGSPLYLFFVGDAELKREPRKPAGTEANIRVCFFQHRKADWYLDMANIERGSKVIIAAARRNPAISRHLMDKWKDAERRFQDFFNAFSAASLRLFSDRELLKRYDQFVRLSTERFSSSAIIDHFALGTDQHIAALLRKEVGRLRTESKFTEIFSVATAPVHQSFINQAEAELLKIAIEAPRNGQRIALYAQKYFWIKNNYIDSYVLTSRHFAKEIRLWRASRANLRKKYRELVTTPSRNARRKAALFRRYHFSPLMRTLLRISEDFTWWQDERKKATYQCIHLGTRLLGEMARRRRIDPELTKYLVPFEVRPWFLRGRPSLSVLRQRQRSCAVIAQRHRTVVLTGPAVVAVRQTMFPKKGNDQVRDIRGLSASVGRVVGTVKIVGSVREIGKVEQGDVIVAVMTRPDYIAGLKKAAAIVTNEGGVTCHAAIVSRELGIPCVIATKIATEVLKDGDLVEVNANHGVVTRLQPSEGRSI